ncbi:MAG TPA: putative Ig domain-containing protein [Verrucomicrobiae bacterium]
MRKLTPARWATGLVLLALTAAVWWQWRTATNVQGPVPPVTSQTAVTAPVAMGPLLTAAPASSLRLLGTNEPVVPSDPEFPYRLRNTQATMDQLVRNDRAILLGNAFIDTGLKARLDIPEHLKAKTDPGSYIVQSRGVINESFRRQLESVGAEIVAYIPNNAYLVQVNADGAKKLASMSWTRAVLPYEPYYKIQETLLESAVKKAPVPMASKLRLTFFPGDLQIARQEVEKLGGTVLSEDRSPFGPQLVVQPQKDSLAALASLPQVQTIERQMRRVPMNDLTRERTGVASNSVTANGYRGLTGTNILVSINDSGVETNFVGLYGRVFPGFNTLSNDLRGHGTHVASILAGDGAGAPTGLTYPFMGSFSNDFRGMAPQAMLLSQDYRNLSDFQLSEYAARTNWLSPRTTWMSNRSTNTLIANNSWGYEESFEYDSSSAIFDAATRDAIPAMSGSQPVLYVFAAGNDGFGGDNGLGGLANSVSSLAAAKNVIAVGASESLRFITNEVTIIDTNLSVTNIIAWWEGTTDSSNEVASYSGRGNTGIGREGQYGRAKPDLLAPGSMIISGRSPTWDEAAYYNPTVILDNTFTNVVLQPGAINSFGLFLPNGTTSFTIEVLDTVGGTLAVPNIDIYASQTDVQPSSNPLNLLGQTPQTVNITPATTGIWYYDLENVGATAVAVNIRETIRVTNNLGNYFQVLSNNLNGPLAPNYRFEVGTSMAAPVVSGILALMQEFFERELGETNNSPALYKAMLINSARTLSQTYGFETRSLINYQGWGLVNLPNALPLTMASNITRTTWPIQYFDQCPTNALATGQTHTRNLTVAPAARAFPLRVTLVWTDPPGNPAASIKLVNDLDLVVSNKVTQEVFYGNDFPSGNIYSLGNYSTTNGQADFVNNVENVYLPGDLSADYAIYVTARRVNVNAVTDHPDGVVQDYALVVSTGNTLLNGALQLDQSPTLSQNNNPAVQFFTSSTNNVPFMGQRVGANPPLITTTNGMNVQWNFYVFTNNTTFPYVSFVSFLSPNLAGDPRVNTYRDPGADIDLYVSTSSDLTNLNSTVVNDCFNNSIYTSPTSGGAVSTRRGGTEFVLIENAPPGQVYYIGIKAEDQKAAEFGFLALATEDPPYTDNGDGTYDIEFFPVPAEIPDGNPEKPEGVQLFGIVPDTFNIHRVIATNTMYHDLYGDLVGTLEHNNVLVTLNNHTFYSSTNQGGNLTLVYDDSDEGDVVGGIASDGPGSLNNFIGTDASGVWMFTMIDNAPQFVGNIQRFTLHIEEEQDTDITVGGTEITFGLPPGRSYYTGINIPPGVVKAEFSLVPTPAPATTGLYVRKNGLPNGTAGLYDYGVSASMPLIVPFAISTADIPPLTAGQYYIQIQNQDAVFVTYTLRIDFTYDLAAAAQRTTPQRSVVMISDDAQTATNQSEINVSAAGEVAGVRVGVRIAHPRPSDLTLRLTSEDRSVLLAEARGGVVNTAGYGFGTNENQIIYTHFSEDTSVAKQMLKFVNPLVDVNFVPFVTPSLVMENELEDVGSQTITVVHGNTYTSSGRLIDTGQTDGFIRFRYMFYSANDSLSLYDSTGNPVPTGNPNPNYLLNSVNNDPALTIAPTEVDISTDTITDGAADPRIVDGAEVSLFGGGPGGVSARVRYFMVNTVGNTSFQLATTAGGTPIDITSLPPGNFPLYFWLVTPQYAYTTTDQLLNIIINEQISTPGTGWDYIIELFDTGGMPVNPPTAQTADQVLNSVVYAGTNLYVAGITEGNANNGIYARFGLPMQTGQTPFESVNWPDNAGGTHFRDLVYSTNGSVYVVGDSFSGATDNTGGTETKGVVVRFPPVGLDNSTPMGSTWATSIPGLMGVEGLEEMHSVTVNMERTGPMTVTEYVYAAGNAQGVNSPARLKLVKLDSAGVIDSASPFEDDTGATTVSAGRGVAVLTNVLAGAQSVFVAGFSDDDGTMRPVIIKFTTGLVELGRQALPVVGQFNNLIAYDDYLYAVGVQDAVSGSAANFLIVKYDYNLNVIWSTAGDITYDLGDEDILYGLTGAGDRLYAVGSTRASSASPTDGVVLEVRLSDGALVTRPSGYAGVTQFNGTANEADSFRDVTMEGSDIYVVGLTTRVTAGDEDTIIVRYHVKDDYLPEESLDNFIGDVANGVWRLEVIDTRTNGTATDFVPRIVDWELQIFLADTNTTTFRLDNAVDYVGRVDGGQTQYFVINAPMTAATATHTLTDDTGGGLGLELYYDQTGPPVIGSPTTSLLMTTPATPSASVVLDSVSAPPLVPGQRYFLAVVNPNPTGNINSYTLNVTFDSTATTFLAAGSTKAGSFSDVPSIYRSYSFFITAADNAASFELSNLTGDVEVLLNRGSPATDSNFDISTTITGTDYGVIAITPTTTMPDVSGFWYARVKSLSGTGTTYDVRIMPPNRAPVVEAIADVTMGEDETLQVQVFASDTDVPVNTLSYSFANAVPEGMTIDPVSGLVLWTPGEAFGPGSYNVSVLVQDDGAPSKGTTVSFVVNVTEVNSAPVLPAATFSASEGSLFMATITATDADLPMNALTYSLSSAPAGMTINSTTGEITWTPSESQGGVTYSFVVSAVDNQTPPLSASRIYQVAVAEVNSAPVFSNLGTQTINEQVAFFLENIASDPDLPAQTLTYRFTSSVPAGMTLDTATGRISWTPDETQGPGNYSVTVEAEDNGSPSLKTQKVINFVVNEANLAPTLAAIPTQSIPEMQAWSYQLEAADADLPAQTLSYSLVSAPSGMTVSSTGQISWTPTEAQGPNTYSVTVLVTDNGSPARLANRTLSVTVTEGNSAPNVNVIADVEVNELTALSVQVVATDSDTPAQTLAYKFTGTVPTGLVINSSSGAITWTPTEAQGPDSYVVTVEVSDGTAATTRSFTITVKEVNVAPVAGTVPNVTVVEGLPVRLVFTATDADLPAQTLTYSLEAGAPVGATINASTGAFEWITSEASPNNNVVAVKITDNGVPPQSVVKSINITVVEVVTNVVDLTSGVAVTNLSRYTNGIVADIYHLNVTGAPGKLLFEAFNLTGDGDLLIRKGAHPTATVFDHSSTLVGTNREQVVIEGADLSGEWFATVVNRESTNITYSISGTVPLQVAGGALLVSTEGIKVETPVFNAGDTTPEFSWTAVQGEKYQVEVSTDLTNWTPLTSIVVTGTTATFKDPTPYTDSLLRFYRIRQLPQ